MEVLKKLHNAIDNVGRLPIIYGLRKSRYDRRFETAVDLNLFRGKFSDYSSAQSSIPTSKHSGYNNTDSASMYEERTRQVYVSDYPVLYWLSSLFSKGCLKVFDIGGHIGVGYYAYQKYLQYPHNLQWKVFDVPAVVERGREIAKSRDHLGLLSFSSDIGELEGADILFASGSLQYLPETLGEILQRVSQRPKYIIVNLLPLHPTETYYTIQTIGTAFCPYRIEKRDRFLRGLKENDFQVVDLWDNLDKRCDIPFIDPSYSLDRYHGFCLERL